MSVPMGRVLGGAVDSFPVHMLPSMHMPPPMVMAAVVGRVIALVM